MAKQKRPCDPGATHAARFAATHWSVVLSTGGDASASARAALTTLCEACCYP